MEDKVCIYKKKNTLYGSYVRHVHFEGDVVEGFFESMETRICVVTGELYDNQENILRLSNMHDFVVCEWEEEHLPIALFTEALRINGSDNIHFVLYPSEEEYVTSFIEKWVGISSLIEVNLVYFDDAMYTLGILEHFENVCHTKNFPITFSLSAKKPLLHGGGTEYVHRKFY